MSKAAQRTPAAAPRWLFGPVPDLALGCGLLYAIFFAAQVAAGPALRSWLPLTLLPFLTLLLGAPHYGATILRVYATRADRRHYFFFGVWVSLLVAAGFVAGLQIPWIGSLILTLYLTWSPWHYSAQNYGVAVLLLRRRGAVVEPWTRRLLRGSFVLSYLLVFLSLHGATGPSPQTAVADYEGSIYDLLSLGIPLAVRDPAMLLTLAAWLLCTAGAVFRLVRGGGLGAAGPTLVLVAVQAIWFLLPASVPVWPTVARIEPFAPEYRAYAFMWVAVGHFLQYLWITTYYAAADVDRPGRALYLGKALLIGISVWALPALVFAPDLLGSLPYDLGLGLLAASVVNLHHFILDGVIWRLRDDRIARMLLGPLSARAATEGESGASDAGGRGPIWRGAAALGWLSAAVVLVVSLFASWESLAGNRAAERGDGERYALAARRRAWLGRDSPEPHLHFGVEAMQAGDFERAHRELDRGMALHPTADLWRLAGELALAEGDPERAFEAFEEAIALDPGSGAAYYQTGRILADQGRFEEALERLERADALWPDTEPIRSLLLELRSRSGTGLEALRP
ncbi:MAG: tetratricopeptide repeat protein [Myxococcota bacterium]